MASLLNHLVENLKLQINRGNSQVRIDSEVLSDLMTEFALPAQKVPFNKAETASLQPSTDSDQQIEATTVEDNERPMQPQQNVVEQTIPPVAVEVVPQVAVAAPLESPASFTAPSASKPVSTPLNFQNLSLADLRKMGNTCSACKLDLGEMRSQETALNEHARLMVITEPSGKTAAQLVDPFAGDAGELLCKMIQALKINMDDIYLTMAHRCYGPGAREHIVESKPYLERQIELVKPEVILIFRGAALNILLGEQVLQANRGRWLNIMGIPAMATFPPAYLLRKDEGKRTAWNDMKQVMARLQA